MELVDQITEVETKTLPTGVVLYIVKGASKKDYSTRDRSLAQTAYGLVGKHALLEFDEKKNEKGFTNRYLNFLSAATTPGPPEAGLSPPPGLFDDAVPDVPRTADDTNLSIAKSVALKAAVRTLPELPSEQRSAASVLQIAEFYMPFLLDWRP